MCSATLEATYALFIQQQLLGKGKGGGGGA